MNESADERITPFYRSVQFFYNCGIVHSYRMDNNDECAYLQLNSSE